MKKITVAAVSTKNHVAQPDVAMRTIVRWGRKAAGQGAELVVFPELCISGYFYSDHVWDAAEPVPGPSTDKLVAAARDLGVILCAGLLEREAGVVFNTQVLADGDGLIGKQRKLHIPTVETPYWRGGFEAEVFDIPQGRLGITICYDSRIPDLARTLCYKGAEIIIMPFAYGTMARAKFPEQAIDAMDYRAGCWRNGCYGIIVNNAGQRAKHKLDDRARWFPGWAGVFDPNGAVVAFTRQRGRGEAMVTATLDPKLITERRQNQNYTARYLRPDLYSQISDIDPPDAADR